MRKYAAIADCLIIGNPQYVSGAETIRLTDLDRDHYRELVPAQLGYEDVFERLDEYLPERGRRYRDIDKIWQWATVDADLERVATQLGFELIYYENAGQWLDHAAFENHALVFVKRPTG